MLRNVLSFLLWFCVCPYRSIHTEYALWVKHRAASFEIGGWLQIAFDLLVIACDIVLLIALIISPSWQIVAIMLSIRAGLYLLYGLVILAVFIIVAALIESESDLGYDEY